VCSRFEIDLAMQYMKRRRFDESTKLLKEFEKKDANLASMAATNLSFIYFLEGEFAQAEKHADIAMKSDRYNAKALVNKGNCLFYSGQLVSARLSVRYAPYNIRHTSPITHHPSSIRPLSCIIHDPSSVHRPPSTLRHLAPRLPQENARAYYLEAVGVEADCVEAIYNLGLVNMKMNNYTEAKSAFEKLHAGMSNMPEALYHLACIAEKGNDPNLEEAAKTFEVRPRRV
jgi:intraflagellar transport protein 88